MNSKTMGSSAIFAVRSEECGRENSGRCRNHQERVPVAGRTNLKYLLRIAWDFKYSGHVVVPEKNSTYNPWERWVQKPKHSCCHRVKVQMKDRFGFKGLLGTSLS